MRDLQRKLALCHSAMFKGRGKIPIIVMNCMIDV